MQYKIPVQIENEDPIFLGLSLRQLTIIMIGFWIAYTIFQSLAPNTGWEIALIPSWFIAGITVAIAVFKYNEMTFIPFILSAIRLSIFPKMRKWENGTDSFQPIDVWFLSQEWLKKTDDVDMQKKIDTMSELQEKLKNI
jgi:hypothetical protein